MDQDEFREFYTRTAPRLRAFVARSCGSVDLADDILQESFIRFLKAKHSFTDEASHRSYLYRTANNLIIDHWRRSRREQGGLLDALFRRRRPPLEIGDDFQRALAKLTPQQRSLLWLAYVEECDHREIAEATGLKQKSVRVLLFRARKSLAGILHRLGLGPEAA